MHTLATTPQLGAARDAIRPGYRSARQGRHLIFYREIPDGIEVVRVLHESMDIERHLTQAEVPPRSR
jgi:toxin ParE1/3/4